MDGVVGPGTFIGPLLAIIIFAALYPYSLIVIPLVAIFAFRCWMHDAMIKQLEPEWTQEQVNKFHDEWHKEGFI